MNNFKRLIRILAFILLLSDKEILHTEYYCFFIPTSVIKWKLHTLVNRTFSNCEQKPNESNELRKGEFYSTSATVCWRPWDFVSQLTCSAYEKCTLGNLLTLSAFDLCHTSDFVNLDRLLRKEEQFLSKSQSQQGAGALPGRHGADKSPQ